MQEITLSATANHALGNASDNVVGTWVIQIRGTAFTGSIAPKAKVTGAPTAAYTAIAYKNRADETTGTAAITGDALIEINAAGLDIRLDVTVSAGSVTFYCIPLLG